MMEPIVTEATHSMAEFTFLVMGAVLVFGALMLVASIFNPEWKGTGLKSFIVVALAGMLLAIGANFISWLHGFSSF